MTKNQIDWAIAAETARHNAAMEQQQAKELAETHRHQFATELETARHQRQYENITFTHNVATEAETARSNKANEAIRSASNDIQLQHNLATEEQARNELAEQSTHNRAVEYNADEQLREQMRTNRAKEEETHRANVANEDIKWDERNSKKLVDIEQSNYYKQSALHQAKSANYTETLNEYYTTELAFKGVNAGSNALNAIDKTFDTIEKTQQNFNFTQTEVE